MRRASPSSSSNSARCSSGTCARMLGDARVDLGGVVARAVDRRSDRAQQRVGQLERVAPGDVEAVEQPAADEVEIRRHRGADVARRTRAAPRASCRGRRRSRGARGQPGRPVIAAISRSSSPDAPADTGAAPRSIASASAGATSVHAPRCASRSPTGSIADPVKRMCWKIICEWCSRQRVRYATSSSSESASASTDCSSRWVLIAAGLNVSSHSRSCSRQTLRSHTSSARAKRCGISSSGAGRIAWYAKPLTYCVSIASSGVP